jgi:hypothetical protein
MKKIYPLLLIFVLSICIVNATPVLKLQQSTIQPQETLIGTISTQGEFLEDITKDDITFYEGRKEVMFDYDLYHFNGTYYFFVIFNKEGDFTIKIKEILFNLAGEVGSKKIEQTISSRYSNIDNQTGEKTNLLSIKPGIVYSLDNSASLSFFNRGENDLSVKIGETTLSIAAFQAKTVQLNLVYPLTYVSASTYKTFSIPVIYLGAKIEGTQPENETNITEVPDSELLLELEAIDVIAPINETISKKIEFANTGDNEIVNITIQNNISMLSLDVPKTISAQDSAVLSFSVLSSKKGFVNDSILLTYSEGGFNYELEIPVTIYILKENSSDVPVVPDDVSCEEFGGELCEGYCNGDEKITTDGYCCTGECVPFDQPVVVDDKKTSAWVYGLLIFLILGLIGYFIYKKYKKVEPEGPEQKIEKSQDKYENRLKGKVKDKITRH